LSLLAIISLTGQDIKSAAKKIKTTLSRFSRLRDVHVQQLLLKDLVVNPPKHLLTALAKSQKRLSKKLKRDLQALTDEKLTRQLRKIDRGLIKQSRSPVAAELTLQATVLHIEQSFTEMVENAQADGGSDIAHIHEVRILFKKYRYSVEAILGIIPAQSRISVESMPHFQALMGEIHDLENLNAYLNKHLKKHPDSKHEIQGIQKKAIGKQRQLIKEYQAFIGHFKSGN